MENVSKCFNKLLIIFLYFSEFLSVRSVFNDIDLSINPFVSLNNFVFVLSSEIFLFSSVSLLLIFDWKLVLEFSFFWLYFFWKNVSWFNTFIFLPLIPSSSSSEIMKSVYPDDSSFLLLSVLLWDSLSSKWKLLILLISLSCNLFLKNIFLRHIDWLFRIGFLFTFESRNIFFFTSLKKFFIVSNLILFLIIILFVLLSSFIFFNSFLSLPLLNKLTDFTGFKVLKKWFSFSFFNFLSFTKLFFILSSSSSSSKTNSSSFFNKISNKFLKEISLFFAKFIIFLFSKVISFSNSQNIFSKFVSNPKTLFISNSFFLSFSEFFFL